MSNLYNIKNFTDEQLFSILDMDRPTDRELEAKIIHLIRKYENMQNEDGNRLSNFFKQVYDHFFDNDEENEEIEGFDTNNPLQDNPNLSTIQTEQIGFTASNPTPPITSVQTFDYSKDKLQLNPLLKQTIKRVISIDSQYRNITTSPISTSFSFDLSEPLKDVLSLKLYSIQIPYTWYIINKNYGANFFYLKASNPNIADANHDIQISIPIGNYGAADLISTINTSFQTEIKKYPISDIQFAGNSIVSYNSFNSKTTFHLDLQNTYNESYYHLDFSNIKQSYNVSDQDRTDNIAAYLGFNNISYSLNCIQSNQSEKTTLFINSETPNAVFTLDNSNNYFTVLQYQGPSAYSSSSTILNTYTIQLALSNGTYTRGQIINAVNQAIQSNGNFTQNSIIEQVDISNNIVINNGNTFFKLTMILDRYKVAYKPNSKLFIIFPNETPLGNPSYDTNIRTIWTLQPSAYSSCFFFDYSYNETSEFISEVPTIQSTFLMDTTSTMKIRFICNTTGYTDGSSNFILPIKQLQNQTQYNLYQFRDLINTAFITANTTYGSIFKLSNPPLSISTYPLSVTNNIFDMQISLNKTFTQQNCKIVIDASSLLVQYFGFPIGTFDLSTNNIITKSFTPQNAGYQSTAFNSNRLFILKTNDTSGNGMDDIIVDMSYQSFYDNYTQFTTDIYFAIQNIQISTQIGNMTSITRPLFNSIFNTSYNDPSYNASLTLNYNFSLSESNYSIYFDGSSNSTNTAWSQFDISSSYDLSMKRNGAFSEISGNITGGQFLNLTSGNNSFTINTNTIFPYIPNNIITVDLSTNYNYTLIDLYSIINSHLQINPLTIGSSITSYVNPITNRIYTKFRICINDIYTTSDYYLEFYDPISFSTCLPTTSSIKNTTWDSTIGWILGFRDYTQYYLKQSNKTTIRIANTQQTYYLNSSNGNFTLEYTKIPNTEYNTTSISLTGDTTLSTNLYNYFLISLDDYIQNHLNDGLVTITRSQTALSVPSYAYSTTRSCDPATNTLVSNSTPQTNSDNVTQKQIYALNQTIQSNTNQVKTYSPGPFIKDLFGLIPIKPGTNGTYYIEFGGTLQNQERVYFGPVNIRKMSIQLLNDRGDIVDLNGSNWSFSFICEQLYRDNS